MKFEPIDFSVYNKPPYYPQYLSRGETKKLMSFDDEQFKELDRLIDATSEQYDLDKAKGILLDRFGKLVDEKRDGNNDEVYRLLIRLRTILNTTSGSVNDVIRVIKFIFSSEVVRIQPNYPAGLTILHDGESPTLDFNKYISQVVAAGVAFDTKELFFFSEKIDISETSVIVIKQGISEGFFGQIKHNGRVARDGRTVRNVETHSFRHDGKKQRDGTAQHKRYFWAPANSAIYPPFRHSSGAQDELQVVVKNDSSDKYLGRIYHNRAFQRNGEINHCGVGPHPASDALSIISAQMDMTDVLPTPKDTQNIQIEKELSDSISKNIRHDGTIKRNKLYIHSNFPADRNVIHAIVEPLIDRAAGALCHNGSFRRNGVERHSRTGTQTAYETFSFGMRFHHFHNGNYRHNGEIRHNGNILIPLE